MPLKYIINSTNFDDWQALYDLLSSLFAPMEARIDPPSSFVRLTPDLLRQKADDEILLVVFDGLALVACAYFKEHGDAIYVGKVAVDENYQGQGIARKIIQHAETFANDRGKQWLELQTRIELTENHQTFAALGFVKTGEGSHEGFDRPTSITMRKRVG